jgi:hypothetical protein
MAKKIRVWDGSAWQDVAPALPYTAVHSAQASMPSTAVDGQIWLDTDASVPSTTVTRWYKLPSAGTTTLSGNDDNSIPLAYTPGYEQVFLNGTLLSRSAADYTATTGTSVVLSSAIVAGDIVEIICPLQITTTDTYTQSATNAAFQANTNNFAAGKNKIINGDFRINQRSFSTSTSGSTYTFDRWVAIFGGGTTTWSAQSFAPGSAPSTGYESSNFFRASVSSQSGSSDYSQFGQYVEDVRNFAGQTITVSFWAKSGSGTPKVQVFARQVFGSGGSAQVDTAATSTTIGSSWNRYSATINVPSISGKTIGSGSYIGIWITLSLGSVYSLFDIGLQSNTFDFWGIQAEVGSNATAFQTATGTLQGELAACQRYYYRNTTNASQYGFIGTGYGWTTAIGRCIIPLPVPMRTIPTSIDTSAMNTFYWETGTTGFTTPTSITDSGNSTLTTAVLNFNKVSGFTSTTYYTYYSFGTSAYIGLSAEL